MIKILSGKHQGRFAVLDLKQIPPEVLVYCGSYIDHIPANSVEYVVVEEKSN